VDNPIVMNFGTRSHGCIFRFQERPHAAMGLITELITVMCFSSPENKHITYDFRKCF